MLSPTSALPAVPVKTINQQSGTPGAWSTSSVRVLHVVPQLAIGGTELTLARIVRALSDEQFSHRVCAMRGCSDRESWNAELDSDPIVISEQHQRGFRFPVRQLVKLMRELKPDVVHTRNWGGLEAVLAARMAGVKAIVHSEHGYDPSMLGGLPLRRRVFRRGMYSIVDRLLAVTSELADYHAAQGWVSRKKFQVIHNGIDTDHLQPSAARRATARREFGIGSNDVVLGWMGRMAPIKDVPTLLRAAASLAKRHPQLRVLLVGSGSEEQRWRSGAQGHSELNGRVVFTGERRDVGEVLSAMDVFVLPSVREGMSNTLLEAMALELPVIATAAGGNSEVVEDRVSGFLFKPGDNLALANLLEPLIVNSELRARMGEAARRRAETHFSLRRMTSNYAQLYLEVAQKRPETTYVRN